MIIHLASEVTPFYKRGGLGDVLGTLPNYLSNEYPNIVISFYYKNRMRGLLNSEVKEKFKIEIQGVDYEFEYYLQRNEDVNYYFINMSDSLLFSDMESRESDSSNNDDDDGEKAYKENFPYIIYFYFAKAAIQLIENLELSPEFILFHDWHVCGCLAFPERIKNFNANSDCISIVLIHNYEFQGDILPDLLHHLDEDILIELLPIYKQYGIATFFALAFKNSDYVATVSETYAEELIQGILPHIGLKFLDLIKKKKIYALPNGIDNILWSPKSSPFIKNLYDIDSYKTLKLKAKQELNSELQFYDDGKPIVLLMARLTEQKGINILIDLWNSEKEAMKQIENLLNVGIKLMIYGRPSGGVTGIIHKRLMLAKEMFPDRFNYISHYTEEKAHKLLAASDIILCPSLFEPCGLVQMYALAFGTVPLVRSVGGLKDTIIPYQLNPEQSTGFYIDEFSHENLKKTIQEAVFVYQNKKIDWNGIIERGMAKDYSWKSLIQHYYSFFETIRQDSKKNKKVIENEIA